MTWIARKKRTIIIAASFLIVAAILTVGLARFVVAFCGFINRYTQRIADQERAADGEGAAHIGMSAARNCALFSILARVLI